MLAHGPRDVFHPTTSAVPKYPKSAKVVRSVFRDSDARAHRALSAGGGRNYAFFEASNSTLA